MSTAFCFIPNQSVSRDHVWCPTTRV